MIYSCVALIERQAFGGNCKLSIDIDKSVSSGLL